MTAVTAPLVRQSTVAGAASTSAAEKMSATTAVVLAGFSLRRRAENSASVQSEKGVTPNVAIGLSSCERAASSSDASKMLLRRAVSAASGYVRPWFSTNASNSSSRLART